MPADFRKLLEEYRWEKSKLDAAAAQSLTYSCQKRRPSVDRIARQLADQLLNAQ